MKWRDLPLDVVAKIEAEATGQGISPELLLGTLVRSLTWLHEPAWSHWLDHSCPHPHVWLEWERCPITDSFLRMERDWLVRHFRESPEYVYADT